jgi:hypothetical protein
MNRGKIENFGRPYELLMNSKTILHGLVYSLDKHEREKLIDIAKRIYEKFEQPTVSQLVESLAKKIDFSMSKSDEENESSMPNSRHNSDSNETDSLLSSTEKNY